jgi:hypothetical protein
MPRKVRDYKQEYEAYHSRPDQIKQRAQRTMARRRLEREGKVRKGDGMDVDHVKPISHGGSYGDGNLRVVPKSKNRSFARTRTGAMKRK